HRDEGISRRSPGGQGTNEGSFAVTDNADPRKAFICAEQFDPRHDVIGQHVDGEILFLWRCLLALADAATVVAEDGNALGGQPLAESLETVVFEAGLVAVSIRRP